MTDSYLSMQREIGQSSLREDMEEIFQLHQNQSKEQYQALYDLFVSRTEALTKSLNAITDILAEEKQYRLRLEQDIAKILQCVNPVNNKSSKAEDPHPTYEEEVRGEPRRRNTFSEPLGSDVKKMRRNTTIIPIGSSENDEEINHPSPTEEDKKKLKKMKKKAEKAEKKKKKLERKKSESYIKKNIDVNKDPKTRRKKSYFNFFKFNHNKSPRNEMISEEIKVKSESVRASQEFFGEKFHTDIYQREKSNDRCERWSQYVKFIHNMKKESIVDLSGMELIQLPESFVLTKMNCTQSLNISCNLFETWPPELTSSYLIELNVSLNIIREIPSSINKLSNLTVLILGSNQLGYIPSALFELSKLEFLDVSNNHISILPDEISKLTNLKEIQIFANKLETLPSIISTLERLNHIDVSFNSLNEIPVSLCNLAKLRHLDFSYNLVNNLPTYIAGLTYLTYLSLCGNKLETLPLSLSSLPNLEKLLKATDNPYSSAELLEASMTGDAEIIKYLRSKTAEIELGNDKSLNNNSSQDHYDDLEQQFKEDLTGMLDTQGKTSPRIAEESEINDPHDDILELEKLLEESNVSTPRDFADMSKRVSLKRLISAKAVGFRSDSAIFSTKLNQNEKAQMEKKLKDLSVWTSMVIEKELLPEILSIKEESVAKTKEELIDVLLGLDLMRRIVQSATSNPGKEELAKYNIDSVEELSETELRYCVDENIQYIEEKYKAMLEILKSNSPSAQTMDIILSVKELRVTEEGIMIL